MSYDFVIDSYAWIEYFRGSDVGRMVRKFLEEKSSVTPTMVVAELSKKLRLEVREGLEREDGRTRKLDFVSASTSIAALDEETARLSGEIDVQRKEVVRDWGLADSVVLATARKSGAKVVTGDRHFADLKDEVVFIAGDRLGKGRKTGTS